MAVETQQLQSGKSRRAKLPATLVEGRFYRGPKQLHSQKMIATCEQELVSICSQGGKLHEGPPSPRLPPSAFFAQRMDSREAWC